MYARWVYDMTPRHLQAQVEKILIFSILIDIQIRSRYLDLKTKILLGDNFTRGKRYDDITPSTIIIGHQKLHNDHGNGMTTLADQTHQIIEP